MSSLRSALTCALLLCAAPAAANDLEAKDVHESIERGAGWLLKSTKDLVPKERIPDRTCLSYELGYLSITTFALLRSGVPGEELEEHFAAMRTIPFSHVYCVSAYLLALEARHVKREPIDDEPGRTRTRLVKFGRQPVPGGDLAEMGRAARWLKAAYQGGGMWSYGGITRPTRRVKKKRRARYGDHSNAQFAIYALHAASVAGVEVEDGLWEQVLTHFLDSQAKKGETFSLEDVAFGRNAAPGRVVRKATDETRERRKKKRRGRSRAEANARARGWGYGAIGGAYGSMTGAGLSCAALAEERLIAGHALPDGKTKKAVRTSVRDAVAWLVRDWKPNIDEGHGLHRNGYYYLWSVEKAFSMAGVEEIAKDRHWWREGAKWLLEHQSDDGAWGRDMRGAARAQTVARAQMVNTSFALLFLNRATLPVWEDGRPVGRVMTGVDRDPGPWDAVEVKGVKSSVTQTLQVLAAMKDGREAGKVLREAKRLVDAMHPADRAELLPYLRVLCDTGGPGRDWALAQCSEHLGTRKEEELPELHARWHDLSRPRGPESDPASLDGALEVLRDKKFPVALKRQALLALARMRSCESIGEVIPVLDHKDTELRRYAWTMLRTLAGEQLPFDPNAGGRVRKKQIKAWETWWTDEGPELVRQESIRRDVLLLRSPAERDAAKDRLRRWHKAAVPRLMAALEDEHAEEAARALLKAITGRAF